MKNQTVLSPVGEGIENLYQMIKDIEADNLILMASSGHEKDIARARKVIEKFGFRINQKVFEDLTSERIIDYISGFEDVCINVATGSPRVQHSAIVASLITGIPALSVSGNQTIVLPQMKLSYYKGISPRKLEIMRAISDSPKNITQISRNSDMSLPLVSYHMNGTMKSEGLLEMGLVDEYKQGLGLTSLGQMVLRGHVAMAK